MWPSVAVGGAGPLEGGGGGGWASSLFSCLSRRAGASSGAQRLAHGVRGLDPGARSDKPAKRGWFGLTSSSRGWSTKRITITIRSDRYSFCAPSAGTRGLYRIRAPCLHPASWTHSAQPLALSRGNIIQVLLLPDTQGTASNVTSRKTESNWQGAQTTSNAFVMCDERRHVSMRSAPSPSGRWLHAVHALVGALVRAVHRAVGRRLGAAALPRRDPHVSRRRGAALLLPMRQREHLLHLGVVGDGVTAWGNGLGVRGWGGWGQRPGVRFGGSASTSSSSAPPSVPKSRGPSTLRVRAAEPGRAADPGRACTAAEAEAEAEAEPPGTAAGLGAPHELHAPHAPHAPGLGTCGEPSAVCWREWSAARTAPPVGSGGGRRWMGVVRGTPSGVAPHTTGASGGSQPSSFEAARAAAARGGGGPALHNVRGEGRRLAVLSSGDEKRARESSPALPVERRRVRHPQRRRRQRGRRPVGRERRSTDWGSGSSRAGEARHASPPEAPGLRVGERGARGSRSPSRQPRCGPRRRAFARRAAPRRHYCWAWAWPATPICSAAPTAAVADKSVASAAAAAAAEGGRRPGAAAASVGWLQRRLRSSVLSTRRTLG